MNKRLTKEQAMEIAVEMEREINAINSRQYIGMPRDELKKIIMTVFHKKSELRIFCMENILQANGDIKAVFAANDEMALGAVEAISGAGKQIMVVGFDATDDAIEAIKAGRMAGTIAQQPALIGSTAVENAVKLISGTSIAESIPVEVTLITKANA